MTICSVCGYPAPENRKTCSPKCDEIQAERDKERIMDRKKLRSIVKPTYKSTAETNTIVLENFAKVLLKNNIPCFTSNVDIDREICDQDEWFKKLNQSYRRRCITDAIENVGYQRYSKANGGKSIYKRSEDPEIIRDKLQTIVSSRG